MPVSRDPARAAAVLARGGLVILPTETVYGLAADARNEAAVARVFAAKGRPGDHPVIVHVSGEAAIDAWAAHVPEYARRLVARWWPGPLTVVLRRAPGVLDVITGGQDTVALRAPAHPLATRVLAEFAALTGDPAAGLAAPSANRFGRVSPTTAADAAADLGSWLDPDRDLVTDGGECAVGIESTVLDCTGPAPRILRPGAVTGADVEAAAGLALIDAGAGGAVRAPGTLAAHYSPRARVVLADSAETARRLGPAGAGFLAPAGVATPAGLVRLAAPASPEEFAHGLYRALRSADEHGLASIVVVPPPEVGLGAAIRDRLTRAAAGSPAAGN